jgi:UDP-perosamine 4-acetyltransferase
MKEPVLLFGCGGHAKSVMDCIMEEGKYTVVAVIGNSDNIGTRFCEMEVRHTDEDIAVFLTHGVRLAFCAVGHTYSLNIRKRIVENAIGLGFNFINVIAPSAIISANAKLGSGIFIGKGCVVNADTLIEDMAILNSMCIVEHDCIVGEFAHIAPGAVLCGSSRVGAGAFIGANSTVLQTVCVGQRSLIGAGSIVTRNMEDDIKAYGIPCRRVMN